MARDFLEIEKEVRQTAIRIRRIEGISTYGALSRGLLLGVKLGVLCPPLLPWPRGASRAVTNTVTGNFGNRDNPDGSSSLPEVGR